MSWEYKILPKAKQRLYVLNFYVRKCKINTLLAILLINIVLRLSYSFNGLIQKSGKFYFT
jgi:hypothetical protein